MHSEDTEEEAPGYKDPSNVRLNHKLFLMVSLRSHDGLPYVYSQIKHLCPTQQPGKTEDLAH